ncbi:hypothetical protein EDEG_01434 [Edhazardia aedis USNM 41457]|uniref:Uncharacterized protein n=1 Tax=Edhazardia aedis (strain USNM 41457) TaxID=1003232 RepID=J9DP33_EDHAE|nr:hypothetical protein EDEG_01434 [Edhazardia aedis USNM 41457]|eukprot:EJW04310.1 hypothetical protein EDEG_01434 [Edhazardia aedis USNM 41457]
MNKIEQNDDIKLTNKIVNTSAYSFDLSSTQPSLVYSNNGNIYFNNYKIGIETSMKGDLNADIKYYPIGDQLFTTVSKKSGLRVYDAFTLENIYNYTAEELSSHTYNKTRFLIGVTAVSGIKFYDLRCRYSINFLSLRNSKKIKFYGNEFVGIGEDFMIKGDIRNIGKSCLHKVTGITDYDTIDNEDNEYIICSKDKYFYISLWNSKANIEKICYSDKMYSNSKLFKYIIVPDGSNIQCVNKNQNVKLNLDLKEKIEDLIFDQKSDLLFLKTKEGIYTVSKSNLLNQNL